ncbi:MAG: acyl-CoA dehydrogenase domain protein [Marmoricola sp.]|nr:acyl-CoA dehydrogenase domain protein [Marmoricola sp.]
MPIGISDDHAELAATFSKWAGSLGGIEAARAVEDDPLAGFTEHSAAVAAMGLAGIAVPEEEGGAGGSVADLAVALEAAASALLPGPLLGTAVASLVLGELAGSVAAGEMRVALALAGDGVAHDAPGATHALVVDGDEVRLVPLGGVELTPALDPDLTRRTTTADLGSGDVVPGLTPARLHQAVVTLAAAEASGVARWCLDTAVEYAGVREQFGQKIGAFQAIKHLCAEMLEHSESVTAAAWDAATAATDDPAQQEFAALVAGTVCFDGAVVVAQACIQVLGGIGFTFEHDAHLYLRRAIALRSLVGSSGRFAGRLADLATQDVRRELAVELGDADQSTREAVRAEATRIAGLPEDQRRGALAETGYLTPHWPKPHGRGASPVDQLVIDQELARAGVERPDLRIGAWAAPTILAHGTDEQRERFVGPTLRGEIEWCQLFSEPGAGSDLASLRTKATRVSTSATDGEGSTDGIGGWRLSGQKVWTSLAERSDWGICLARTNAEVRQHAGITYFLVDMRSEGIDVRPLRELTGQAMFNEVFLDDVFVPDDCVVGEVDGGWRLARTTLANERVAMAGSRLGDSPERAVSLLASGATDDRVAVGRAVAWATVVSLLSTRATLRSLSGQGPGAESSVAKLVGVRSRQDSAELVVTLLGDRLFAGDEVARQALHEQLTTRCLSIAGGTTQVLRNVAGERILGLPRG